MTHNTIAFASILSAALLPLTAQGALAGNAWAPYPDHWALVVHEQTLWAAPWPPYSVRFYFLRRLRVIDDPNTTIYLNGWSSSSNPHDCNRGCVNSNGS